MSFPTHRPRRLRTTPAMRRLTAEHRLAASELILPAFIREGLTEPNPIASMPGVQQHTTDTLKRAAAEAVELGVGGIMLFGIPAVRDPAGTASLDPDGVLNKAIRDVRAEVGDGFVIMSDVCLDELPTTGTAVSSTPTGTWTTTQRSRSTAGWPWPRRRPAPMCSARPE